MRGLLLGGISVGVFLCGCGGSGGEKAPPPESDIMSMRVREEGQSRAQPPVERLTRETDAERSRKLVAEYEARLTDDPEDQESQGAMLALANLYRQKFRDYEQAAYWYERYIDTYPQDSRIGWVFSQLSYCLEQLDDPRALREFYREMMEFFPEGTNEHEFARQKYEAGEIQPPQ